VLLAQLYSFLKIITLKYQPPQYLGAILLKLSCQKLPNYFGFN